MKDEILNVFDMFIENASTRELRELIKGIKVMYKENDKLHSIIKEVRELIKSKWEKDSYWEDVDNCLKFCTFNEYEKEDILEILDKENKE